MYDIFVHIFPGLKWFGHIRLVDDVLYVKKESLFGKGKSKISILEHDEKVRRI